MSNHLYLYLTNYYFLSAELMLTLLGICLTLVNANISSKITFMPVGVFGQVSIGSMVLFLQNA